MVTCINRCTGVYETEMAIRMSLVANNSSIIYTNASTDPYTNSNGSTMLTQNQTTCDSVIGTANYDYGHVVSTGGGGVAQLGVICVAGSKAKGVTGSPSPTGDAFWIDYVVHEMGHQFGANHTFNSSTSNCGGGNRSASHAYEPGSGSTIMAYAGICGADDLQPHSDPYMAFDSLDAINAFSGTFTGSGTGYTCAVKTATGNNSPTVNAGSNYTIPISTPFALTAASASDPDGDALTYCWEERDLGASITLAAGDNGSSPIIRTFNPSTSPTRIIPNLTALLNNTTTLGERLPTTSRTMTFRCTVRDNKAAAGTTGSATMTVTSTTSSGPFTVTSPNTAVSWQAGAQTVTWNVANTTAAPVSCANVDIYLSTDGGNTWPATLATAVPNNGSAVVTIPSVNTSTARIKVQGSGNIFFDVSNVNFTITPVAPPGNFSLTSPSNGASNVSTSPTLSWGTSSGANSYLVEIDTDSGFAAPLFFSQSTASTSLALPANTLNNNTIYYWRVTSSNPGGATTVSTPAVSSFTTVPPSPGPFTLSSPADGATGIGFGPTLTWNASSGATSYLVEVNTDSTFVASNVFSQSVGGTSVGLPANTLVGSTTYYWRVTASNSFSLTAVGSPNPSSFVTAPPPCPADINGDHVVNTTDLGILLTNFGSSVTPNTGGDCNGDGVVNSLDLGIMLSAFGSNC